MRINKQWIYDHNRLMAPVFAIIFSVLVTLLAVYTISEIIFLVPVVTFFSFHYTKLYRLKLRILASFIVFIVVAFVAVALLTNVVYSSQPTYKTQFLNEHGNLTGSDVLASVTPYSGSSQSYTFQFYIMPNGTLNYNSINLNIAEVSGKTVVVHFSEMVNQTYSGNNTLKLTYTTGLGTGIYSYNLTAQSSEPLHTPNISGPINSPFYVLYGYLLPTYAVYYLIIFELVFVAGVFIARSISNSRRYSQPQPPQNGDQKKP